MDGFSLYIDRLQILGFFSGYLLLYALILGLFAGKKSSNLYLSRKAVSLLPYSYALCGLLYAGLLLRNLTAAYQFDASTASIDFSLATAVAASSLFFFIPVLSRKPLYSLLHCLVLVGYTLVLILSQQSIIFRVGKSGRSPWGLWPGHC